MISFEGLKSVCEEIHAVMAASVFGEEGVNAIFEIMEIVRELYKHIEPVRIKSSVIVFRRVVNTDGTGFTAGGQLCNNLALLCQQTEKDIILEIQSDGRRYIHNISSVNPKELASTAVVYEYQNGREYFFAGVQQKPVPVLDRAAMSQFCGNTFFALHEALQYYAAAFVLQSSCLILKSVWADENRLFLRSKPEVHMRRSLTQFLESNLGAGFEVRPEQNMDETHPVDIKITKKLSNRLMIIEIKWMGDSLNEEGKITTPYRDARANDGAGQLAGYLDQNKVMAPLNVTQGYYVIFDARRHGLRADTKVITKTSGLHYANKEIAFDTEYHKIRDDFNPPYRMFTEPKYINN